MDWSSGDASVATVDGSGRVEAVGMGETEVTAAAVEWTSEDEAVATVDDAGWAAVDAAGLVTAVGCGAGGDATITATADGVSGTASVHVLGQIAFVSDGLLGNDDIYVMDADGSNPIRITDDTAFDSEPAWRPRP